MDSHWHDNPFWKWLKKYWTGLIGLGFGIVFYVLGALVLTVIGAFLWDLLTI